MKSFTQSAIAKFVSNSEENKNIPKRSKSAVFCAKKKGKLGCYHKRGMKARQDFVWPCRPNVALEFHEGIFDAKKALAFDAKTDWLEAGSPGGQIWWKNNT